MTDGGSPRKWRVLFVLEWFPPHIGGVETLFGEVATRLAGDGHHATVLTCAVKGAPAREELPGLSVHRIRLPRIGTRYFFTLFAIFRAVRLARSSDLVHTSTYNAAIPGWLAAKLARRPCLLSAHEIWDEHWHRLPGIHRWVGWGYRAFERAVLTLPFDHYHTGSAYTRRRLIDKLRLRARDVTVVYDPVDYEFWEAEHPAAPLRDRLGLPAGTFIYLGFGRPGVAKGMEYLVEAAATMAKGHPSSRLVLLLAREPANQYRRLRERVETLGIGGHVVFLDSVPRAELPGILRAADCVVVPSLLEGFGYAAVETAILGQRLITTSGHSVEEVVEGARFVAPGDSAALAIAIGDVADGENPRARPVARFDAERSTSGFLELYRRLLEPDSA